MKDLVGERSALEQTRIIVKGINAKGMSKKLHKEIVHKIYTNQLKKFTNYNRLTIRKLGKELFKPSVSKPVEPLQGSNKKQDKNIVEQGSQ